MATQVTISLAAASDFASLFAGSTTAYGKFTIGADVNEAKVKGKCQTVKAKITEDLYYRHLNGEDGVGVIPIRSDNTCFFAAIDFDVYTKEKQQRVIKTIDELRMPLVPFRSKSGGLHLYIFFREPVKATVVVKALKQFKELLDMDEQTEIFPKQTRLSSDDIGNWINLPYFRVGPDCKRHMWNPDMTPVMSVEVALQTCMEKRQSTTSLEQFFESLPLMDGPPCLQRIYIAGQTTNRSNFLLALGRYLKTKFGPDDYKEHLIDANNRLANPLPAQELMTTVMVSLEKKNYSYGCSKEPICHFCNKKVCAQRKYGIGGKEVSNLSFGEFRQILTDPPSYEWSVNENILRFDSAASIINQEMFRRQCIDVLCLLPARLNDNAWTDIVNTALANVIKINVDAGDDISPGALITGYIIDFIKKRRLSSGKLSITRGLVYKDDDPKLKSYVFDIKALAEYLTVQKQLNIGKLSEIKVKMAALGGTPIKYVINTGLPPISAWAIPIDRVDQLSAALPQTSEAEFIQALEKDFNV